MDVGQLVVIRFLAQIIILRDGSKNRDIDRFGKSLRLARAVVLVNHQPSDTNIAAQLAEVFYC